MMIWWFSSSYWKHCTESSLDFWTVWIDRRRNLKSQAWKGKMRSHKTQNELLVPTDDKSRSRDLVCLPCVHIPGSTVRLLLQVGVRQPGCGTRMFFFVFFQTLLKDCIMSRLASNQMINSSPSNSGGWAPSLKFHLYRALCRLGTQ